MITTEYVHSFLLLFIGKFRWVRDAGTVENFSEKKEERTIEKKK